MAKCKMCKKSIPVGTDYCKDCQEQESAKAREAYLDSLLNSVKNSGPSMEEIYKRKKHSDVGNDSPGSIMHLNPEEPAKDRISTEGQDWEDIQTPGFDDDYRVDFSDIEDFDQQSYENDLQELEIEDFISDEDLFGEKLSDLFSWNQEGVPSAPLPEKIMTADKAMTSEEGMADDKAMTSQETKAVEEPGVDGLQNEHDLEFFQQREEPGAAETDSAATSELLGSWQAQPSGEADEANGDLDSEIDMDLDDLLGRLEERNTESPDEEKDELMQEMPSLFMDDINSMIFSPEDVDKSGKDEAEQQGAEWPQEQEEEQDDFLSLLGQMSDEDPVLEDVRAIHDLIGSASSNVQFQESMPGDVGEVFSDALTAVSSLNDYELGGGDIPEESQDKVSSKDKKKKSKKDKKAVKEKNKKEKKAKEAGAAGEKSGLSLFQRIFGNIKDEKATESKKELLKADEAQIESPKKSKVKGKKSAVSEKGEDTEGEEGNEGKGKAAKKERKKEKAERKAKSRDIIQVIDEIDEEPGRINRVGAAVVLFFFAIITLLVVLGSNIITYTLSIEYATNYFNNRKYTQAYNQVYGVEIKDEDIEIYDKIMTVMFVNKQLNSYNNYYALKKYPEALDSLLKGLSRYDKYIELATMLGIESDLDYVRAQILAELNNVFNLTEKEAAQILQYESMEDYSLSVYDVVLEKMNN